MGLPFVTSADLVSAYPATSVAVADYVDDLIPLLAMTQNAQTGVTYSFLLADFTKLVTLNNASAVAVTLPLEATVAWPTSTQLRLLNLGAGTVTVAGAAGVTISGTPLTLAQFKGANLIKTGTNTWVMLPFASGVGAAVYSDANTGTYTGYAYKTFAASGTLTVTTAGFADIVVCGGGGGGGCFGGANVGGGGGAGGALIATNVYLPVGTLTVTVGAGGAGGTGGRTGNAGNTSRLADFYSSGGGSGAGPTWLGGAAGAGGNGASGGGAFNNVGVNGGAGITGLGNNGGSGASSASGGGGGAGAVGANATLNAGAAGGAGTSTAIAGTTPTGAYVAGSYSFAGGGGGAGASSFGSGGSGGGGNAASAGVAGSANTGSGGGGGDSSGGNGGSGLIIVKVAV